MTTVLLHGELGAVCGEKWELFIKSPAEALRAIEAQTEKLFKYLHEKAQVEFRVIINGKDHKTVEDLVVDSDNYDTIEFVPVLSGAGGLWQTILGVVLIVVAVVAIVYAPYLAPLIGMGASTFGSLALNIGLIGLSMTLGGIAQMMTKTPQIGGPSSMARTNKKDNSDDNVKSASYLFSGVVNTTRQGSVVPLGYGRLIVGSQLISFGLSKSAITGVQTSDQQPGETDDVLTTSVWATLHAQTTRYNWVKSTSTVTGYSTAKIIEAATAMLLLRTTLHPFAAIAPLLGMLKVLVFLYSGLNGTQKSATKAQLLFLYNWLGLTGLDTLTASWDDLALAIASYYASH